MNQQKKKKLMEKYGIKGVGGGTYGEGFFDCLEGIDNKTIKIKGLKKKQ